MSEPNYPVMELETKLDESKDEIIRLQKIVIEKLQEEVTYLKGLISWNRDETHPADHMIAPPVKGLKPRIRTVSEVQVMLERRSSDAFNAAKSIEEVENAE